jgi:hypothetical protein
MKTIFVPVLGLALLGGLPALAQLSPGGALDGSPTGGGAAPQPLARTPDIAPPALPGAGEAPVATGPQLQKLTTGDPTQALFDAVNKGDYNAAQDAISRGANLDAQDPLGETPLDLSVALNRSSITFLLLSARNETSEAGAMGAPMTVSSAPVSAPAPVRVTPEHARAPVPGNVTGTPDPAAGFLGFGSKS